ncbi:DUF72 domain-containing protein [Pseudomonas asuensis]|uniref:DUF72 domain-containing protein n=1 Tax=Pseudomonas asuensis TaxID=1825787 RepID=A0ABQ2H260_9PSED|nr:DUF72 domain-containing protein [Pseudomonas asuensis]GGM23095.1 hypothetical protein GCM10009425_37440 [Pseudomonas asuensis]
MLFLNAFSYIGCAGWSLPRSQWPEFPVDGTHLQRYAGRFNAVEINSSFYRSHQPATYAKWAESTPEDFRFAVKIPRQITHIQRLAQCGGLLNGFLSECGHLGEKLGCLLIQLPPSLAFNAEVADAFLDDFRARYNGPAVLEPRHPSWLQDEAQAILITHQIGQVAADPSPLAGGDKPSAWPGIAYYRLHGSPTIYHSSYAHDALETMAQALTNHQQKGVSTWCIFDNTASGAAVPNALALQHLIEK